MSEEKDTLELSEAQIAVHWKEEEYIYPPAPFIAQANMTDPSIYERFSLEHFPECFKEYADLLTWYQYWHTTLDTRDAPCWKWFVGGKINASYNCVDRHLPLIEQRVERPDMIEMPVSEDDRFGRGVRADILGRGGLNGPVVAAQARIDQYPRAARSNDEHVDHQRADTADPV